MGHTELSTTARYDRGDKDKAFELAGERQLLIDQTGSRLRALVKSGHNEPG